MYTIDGVTRTEESVTNLKVRKLFADKELRGDITQLVEYIFDTGTLQNAPPFTPDDLSGCMDVYCPGCGEPILSDVHMVTEEETADFVREDSAADPEERYRCPICGAGYPSADEAQMCCVGLDVYRCDTCGAQMLADDYDALAASDGILEWWLVSPWLCRKLEDYGEAVIRAYSIWGRTSTNPEVFKDGVIGDICKEIGILEGQPHDWSKYFKS